MSYAGTFLLGMLFGLLYATRHTINTAPREMRSRLWRKFWLTVFYPIGKGHYDD